MEILKSIDKSRWYFLVITSLITFFMTPMLIFPMSMATQMASFYNWNNELIMLLISSAFIPNIIICLLVGIYMHHSPNGILFGSLVMSMISTFWFITSLLHNDYVSAFFARMMFGIGALNAMTVMLYLYDTYFMAIGKRTFAFGLKGFVQSISESFSFLMISWLYSPSLHKIETPGGL